MYDVITVGSATIDCFVETGKKLFKTLHKNHGEIVFVPFGSKITVEDMEFLTGGGGTNTAVSFARLGLKVSMIGKFGGSQAKQIFEELKKEKIDTSLIVNGDDVGFSVVLDAKAKDRTILTHKGSNDKLSFKEVNKSKIKTRWFYFASMVGESYNTLEKLAVFAKSNKIKVAFNPSLYIANKGVLGLAKILKSTDVLVFNKEEAMELLNIKSLDSADKSGIKSLLKKLISLIKENGVVIVTDGKNGSHTYDGKKYYFMKTNGMRPHETTGAGDSFASAFVAGYIKDKSLEYCLQMGQANAESVIMHMGAKNDLLTFKEIEKVIKDRPSKIKVEEI